MKKLLKNIVILSIGTFIIASCASPEKKMLDNITKLEAVLAEDTLQLPEQQKAVELIDAYEKFATKFPKHEKSPHFLFNAGRYCMSYGLSLRAISFFDKIIEDYPNYDKQADSYFLKGFVYDSQLNNIPKARQTYEAFIEAYPNHELVAEAEQLLNLLGKSMEEIIAEFERKNNEEIAEE